MYNFRLSFSQPLFLLLLIPAIAITLIPFFKLNKKYRYNRNRVTSLVLHVLVTLFCTLTLSGLVFRYSVPNTSNEIIYVVDVSDTQEDVQDLRDDFLSTVIQRSRLENCKVGIVTFGYDQQYAVPLTDNYSSIMDKFTNADLPDTSATNIADALTYAKSLFSNEESGRIVLITDGKETDNSATAVIRSVAASGIRVDTVELTAESTANNVQIVGVKLPDYHVNVGEQCNVSAVLNANVESGVALTIYDNGEEITDEMQALVVKSGETNVTFKHTFETYGLHKLTVKVEADIDDTQENNVYNTYFYLDVFRNVLILESTDDTSTKISEILSVDNEFNVTVKNIYDENLKTGITDLLQYDQIILNNIANSDMPEGFDETLFTYVNTYGGGLFTVGGEDEGGNPHAYDQDDMRGTVYQQMLPVQAIEYTPPVGIMIIIDTSGSMADTTGGRSYLEWAKDGAKSCLNALTERDYIGIMTLDNTYDTILPLTPRPLESRILSAIESLEEANGGTVFPGAIDRAGEALRSLKSIDKRHIILVTDGGVPEAQCEEYESYIDSYYKESGITLSVVLIGKSASSTEGQLMKKATDLGHGRLHAITNSNQLIMEMREDLNAPEIKTVNYESFYPIINDVTSPVFKDVEYGTEPDAEQTKALTVMLDGFYGTKIKPNADLLLMGDYQVPIYAQWKFGKGVVGSFMCDMNGIWSSNFIYDANGQNFIRNVVANLMPIENIRPSDINVRLREQNYTNNLEIYNLADGEKITAELIETGTADEKSYSLNSVSETKTDVYVTSPLSEANGYSRASFVVKKPGTYLIELKKFDKDGNEVATTQIFKTFSYSLEYDETVEETELNKSTKLLETLAENGNGSKVADLEDPYEIFSEFSAYFDRSVDPRMVLIITSLVLFLLDVCVRKFKFKWIHELIREKKEKK